MCPLSGLFSLGEPILLKAAYQTKKKGFQLASKCSCCSTPCSESLNHLFYNSPSHEAWKHYELKLNICSTFRILKVKLNYWWMAKLTPCHNLFYP